jgi:hypothetical protein
MGQTTSNVNEDLSPNDIGPDLLFTISWTCRDEQMIRSFSLSSPEDFVQGMTDLNNMRNNKGHSHRICLYVTVNTKIGERVMSDIANFVVLTTKQRANLLSMLENMPEMPRLDRVNAKLCMRTKFMPLTDRMMHLQTKTIENFARKFNIRLYVEKTNHMPQDFANSINTVLKSAHLYFDSDALKLAEETKSGKFFMWPKDQGGAKRSALLLDTGTRQISFIDFHPMKVDSIAVSFGDGKALICGGSFDENAQVTPPNYSFIFNPNSRQLVEEDYDLEVDMTHLAAAFNPYEERVYLVGFDRSDLETKIAMVQTWDNKVVRPCTTVIESRVGHTAVFVDDVTLMIGGGVKPRVIVNGDWRGPKATQMFDVANGTFRFGPSFIFERVNHTMTKMGNGDFLVVGGSLSPLSTEIYRTKTGVFEPGPILPSPRVNHSACLMRTGVVQIIGGDNNSRSVCFYDPLTKILDDSTEKLYNVDFVNYEPVPLP